MRLRTLFKILAVGVSAGAITQFLRGRRTTPTDDLAPDPSDPVQRFDNAADFEVDALEVDALSTEDMEAAQDLAVLEVDLDRIVGEDEVIQLADIDDVAVVRDGGDLYGVHTPAAVDRSHPDNDQAFVEGQNWIEALETSAIENGAEPEQELADIADDEDLLRAPHPSISRDIPVADFGSGGRRGL